MQLSPLAFDRYVAPARLRPQLWRLVLGLGVILAAYFLWMGVLAVGIWALFGGESIDRALATIGTGSSPVTLLGLLLTFVGMALGVFVAVRLVHKRSIASLFGPRRVVLRDFVAGVVIFGVIALPGAIWSIMMLDVMPGVSIWVWLAYLPLAVALLLVQTGAEELVFRGYMQQQLAARFASRWVWMVLPSVIFGLVHYAPDQLGSSLWPILFLTGFFGLVMADLTARSGALGMAWGLHFANNFFAIMIFTTGEALDALALFRLPFSASDTEEILPFLGFDLLGIVVIWAICRWHLRER
jgi:membrane protease YdiL (CAAX protease family)